jgi:hypothetical protein
MSTIDDPRDENLDDEIAEVEKRLGQNAEPPKLMSNLAGDVESPGLSEIVEPKIELPELPDPLSEEEIQARLRGALGGRDPKAAASDAIETANPNVGIFEGVKPETSRALGFGLQLAYVTIGIPIIAFLIGMGIDAMMKTGQFWRNWLTIGSLGVVLIYLIFALKNNKIDDL